MPFAATWMDFETAILSEIRQKIGFKIPVFIFIIALNGFRKVKLDFKI